MVNKLVTLADAQAKLPELLAELEPGQELHVVVGNCLVGRLTGARGPVPPEYRVGPGFAVGLISVISDDDDHLADFGETTR